MKKATLLVEKRKKRPERERERRNDLSEQKKEWKRRLLVRGEGEKLEENRKIFLQRPPPAPSSPPKHTNADAR